MKNICLRCPVRKSFVFTGLLGILMVSSAHADTVYFKDGRIWNGIITDENEKLVELDLGFDRARLERYKIDRIERSSVAEKWALIQKNKIRQADRDRMLSQRSSAPQVILLKEHRGHLFADVVLNGSVKATLLVDTGASVVTLSRGVAQKLGLREKDFKMIVPLSVADGRKTRGAFVPLESIRLQGVEAREVNAVILLDETRSDETGDGLLGMSFLSQFKFNIDPKNKHLILEKLR